MSEGRTNRPDPAFISPNSTGPFHPWLTGKRGCSDPDRCPVCEQVTTQRALRWSRAHGWQRPQVKVLRCQQCGHEWVPLPAPSARRCHSHKKSPPRVTISWRARGDRLHDIPYHTTNRSGNGDRQGADRSAYCRQSHSPTHAGGETKLVPYAKVHQGSAQAMRPPTRRLRAPVLRG